VILPNRLLLAPMSGVTTSAFRRLVRQENPSALGLVVTEFVSIEGIARGNDKSFSLMKFRAQERPLAIQIFGSDIDRMVEAAKVVEQQGADILDINSGCPVPKVVKRGGGCELMRHPEHLGQLLEAVVKAVSIPVTLKFRSGWSESNRNGKEIARIAEESGIQMITVHGRTREQLDRGFVDLNYVDEIAQERSIPVIGSGDIVDAHSAQSRATKNIAGLMIGRGALQNPWIFHEIINHWDMSSQSVSIPSEVRQAEIRRVLRQYVQLLLEDTSPKAALGNLKQFASQAIRDFPGSSTVRRAACICSSIEEMLLVFNKWEDRVFDNDLQVSNGSYHYATT